ncbi:MAG: VOC family protein [Clostridia bacterium]|nr:VOC family protein [Clostridia bacterium]
MKFCWSTLMVKNLEESINFYRDIVGLEVDRRFPAGPGMEIAFLGDGETKIELICDKSQKEIIVGPDISWGFETDSVNRMMSFVKEKGIDILSGPFKTGNGSMFFYIKDPDGMKIQFFEEASK